VKWDAGREKLNARKRFAWPQAALLSCIPSHIRPVMLIVSLAPI
jgi:hypothetical protein